ncbi:putative ABC transport system permease protein [Pseudobutyrivibrio sp. 49]|uniref:FtsX-like permease family protein n=1 Tax=Pseudobutyrivibrio sp. 49 TaxID=1855344 RepID=UPI00088D784C|nr:ABC transporter permease [Pseudobutyrivibrio sp. 49]SDI06877.1 putative ABC transport system permease protein [Pseudobutyrivibrio sp. 49]
MNNHLLSKLAISGIQNNKKTVFPYIGVSAITVMLFEILRAMIHSRYIINDSKPAFYGANYIVIFLMIGSFAVAFFSSIFMFYGNQFVMKSRRKEIGLYGILGLSKKHVTVVLLIESLIEAVASIGIGIVGGAFLNKLMVMFLYRLTHQQPVKGLEFPVTAFVETFVFFMAVFAACLIYNLFTIRVGKPIELLKSENTGEKEPKVKVALLVIGAVCLALGYYLALSTSSTLDAMERLMKSIPLVMVATYALFVAGSIFVLKLLKQNKKYYYQTKNFISISNLLFRMKHNAVGLASICILSTGVILLMVCSGSLMALGEQNINAMIKQDVMIRGEKNEDVAEEKYLAAIKNAADENGIQPEEINYREFIVTTCVAEENKLLPLTSYDFNHMSVVYIMTLEDYNHYAGTDEILNSQEILRYSDKSKDESGDVVSIFGKDYVEKAAIDTDAIDVIFDSTMTLFGKEVIIVPDETVMSQLIDNSGLFADSSKTLYVGFDSKKIDDAQFNAFKQNLNAEYGDAISVKYKQQERSFFYGILGGAFFVGIFLAILFLIETVMIIYYKQMSEGFEDQKRFKILSNAGLTEKEVKQTIRNQVRIIFFLPVGTAIIHMLVASKILRLFMNMLVMVDTLTFFLATLAVCLIFVAVYTLVYKMTSKQYYNIVYGAEAEVRDSKINFYNANAVEPEY